MGAHITVKVNWVHSGDLVGVEEMCEKSKKGKRRFIFIFFIYLLLAIKGKKPTKETTIRATSSSQASE